MLHRHSGESTSSALRSTDRPTLSKLSYMSPHFDLAQVEQPFESATLTDLFKLYKQALLLLTSI